MNKLNCLISRSHYVLRTNLHCERKPSTCLFPSVISPQIQPLLSFLLAIHLSVCRNSAPKITSVLTGFGTRELGQRSFYLVSSWRHQQIRKPQQTYKQRCSPWHETNRLLRMDIIRLMTGSFTTLTTTALRMRLMPLQQGHLFCTLAV